MTYLVVMFLLQYVMQDRWMNIGFDDNELRPHVEPKPDYDDLERIGDRLSFELCHTHSMESRMTLSVVEVMVRMGYSRDSVRESVRTNQYNDVMASYLLLGRAKVSVCLAVSIEYHHTVMQYSS